MDNCKKWQKQNWPNVCTEFVLTLRGDTLEFLSSLHKKIAKYYRAKFLQTRLKLARSEGIKRGITRWLPWKRGLPVVTVFLTKQEDSGTRNYV